MQLAKGELVGFDRSGREGRPDEPAQVRVSRRVCLQHRTAGVLLLLVEILEIGPFPGDERLGIARDGDDVRVLRHAPVAAAVRPVVPPDGRLATEEREGLVGEALGEDVVLEVDIAEAGAGVDDGHRVVPSKICSVFRSE